MKHLPNLFKYLFPLLLFAIAPAAHAAVAAKYTHLVKQMGGLSTDKLFDMAEKFEKQEKNAEAVVLYSIVFNRFRDDMPEADKNRCAQARLKAGSVYYSMGNYTNALEEFIEGIKLCEQCERPEHEAKIYNNIGNVYCLFQEYETGVAYYKKAYACCRRIPNRKTEHRILVNLSGMFTFMGNVSEAKKYYNLAERTKDPKNAEDVFMSGYTLSLIELGEQQYAPAIARLNSLSAYALTHRLAPRYQCFTYQELYKAYTQLGRSDSTLKYLRLCDETARRNNMLHTFSDALKALSDFYERNGDIAKANRYKSQYLSIKDSIYNLRQFDVAKNSLVSYEVGKTVKEMEDFKIRDEQKMQTIRAQRIIIIVAVIAALLIMAVLLLLYKQKQKLKASYQDLYTVNRDFISTQEQLTARLSKNRELIHEKEAEIARLTARLSGRESAVELPDALPAADKYATSNLADEKRQALAEAIQNVMENSQAFCDCEFSLDTLAALVGSNSKYVSQVINDVFGKNFSSYVNTYRIHLVCIRFSDASYCRNYTMATIANSVGFKSYASFTGTFKKIIGISPSLYWKKAREGEKTAS